jgi:hypothetical protein
MSESTYAGYGFASLLLETFACPTEGRSIIAAGGQAQPGTFACPTEGGSTAAAEGQARPDLTKCLHPQATVISKDGNG